MTAMNNHTEDIKLSICIPTYNRACFLEEALESVVSQAVDGVEIVVVDGASPDHTPDVIQKYQKRFKNLVYHRNEKNMGVDRDMARSVELARGDYCWLLSDDDALKPEALGRILEEIKSGYEIYLCNVTACDLTMKPLRDRSWLSSKIKDKVFYLHEKRDLIEYCNNANSIGAFFSYMSSIILSCKEWKKAGYNDDFDGSAYAMASTLFAFIKKRCRLKYVRNPLIFWRNDNESFQFKGGPVKRFLLDFDGYARLANEYLPEDQKVRQSFLRVMRREHPWYTIIHVSSFIDDRNTWRNFREKLLMFGYGKRMTALCYALGRHKKLVYFCVQIKRRILKSYFLNGFIRFLQRIRR